MIFSHSIEGQRMRKLVRAVCLAAGVGHDSWTRTYENPEIWSWLLARRKATPERPR